MPKGRYRKSSLGGHNAGMGIAGIRYHDERDLAPYRPAITDRYSVKYPGVTLPHENPKTWEALSGECEIIVPPKQTDE